MKSDSELSPTAEPVFLFGIDTANPEWNIEDSLTELSLLARTAGLRETGRAYQRRRHPHPTTYMGPGKVEELVPEMRYRDTVLLLLDDELSPAQHRNLERLLPEGFRIIDRSALILDIFTQHAHSREGKLQVELAQCQYNLPRLSRLWTHLERQSATGTGGVRGSVGLRGPGETQIETDRRRLRQRIALLKQELERVRTSRQQHRMQRRKRGLPVVTLTGYTNAGKSSLLNTICGAMVVVEDQLFATLDPTTRRVSLPGGREVLFTDTVGFIQKLPHDLIAAFHSTLEEIVDADLVVHVVDITHPKAEAQRKTAERTLRQIGIADAPLLTVWNKIDMADSIESDHDSELRVSARTGDGIEKLLSRVESTLNGSLQRMEISLPYSEGGLLSKIRETGTIELEKHGNGAVLLRVLVPPPLVSRLTPYTIKQRGRGFRSNRS